MARSDDRIDVLREIREACIAGDHATIAQMLSMLEDAHLVRQALAIVLPRFEGSPWYSQYLVPAVEWLLTSLEPDLNYAATLIERARRLGVTTADLDRLVQRHVIEPKEDRFRHIFEANVALLGEHIAYAQSGVLDFDNAKRQAGLHRRSPEAAAPLSLIVAPGRMPATTHALFAEVTNVDLLVEATAALRCVYLVLDDRRKLQWLLLFEDLSPLRSSLEAHKLVVFVEPDERYLLNRFEEGLLLPPDALLDLTSTRSYSNMVDRVRSRINSRHTLCRARVNERFARIDASYYCSLFSRPPYETKILVISSPRTQISHSIAANWHRAFLALGYECRFFGDLHPYEDLTHPAIYRYLDEYRPDVVFAVNGLVGEFIPEEPARASVLWLHRFRDENNIQHGVPYQHNMMVIAITSRQSERARERGFSADRVFKTPDGVDVAVFAPRYRCDADRFSCDVTSANNVAGIEEEFLEEQLKYLRRPLVTGEVSHGQERNWMAMVDGVVSFYKEIEEMARSEYFLFHLRTFEWLLNEHLERRGIALAAGHHEQIAVTGLIYMECFARRRLVEWVLEAGFTRDIKLWGKGWVRHPRLAPFAMGVARHGEELAAAYQHAKIAISDNPTFTLHERNFEILSSGGFPLIQRSARPEIVSSVVGYATDDDQITTLLREDVEVAMFTGRDEFLQKVAHYLDHPHERAQMAARAREKVLGQFSTTAVARKTMDFVTAHFQRLD